MSLTSFRRQLQESAYGDNDKKWFQLWLDSSVCGSEPINAPNSDESGYNVSAPNSDESGYNVSAPNSDESGCNISARLKSAHIC